MNSSSTKGIPLLNLTESVARRTLIKESSIKAVEDDVTWPVRTRVTTDMKVAAVPEVNDIDSMIDERQFFFRIIQTSFLQGKKNINKSFR